MHCWYFGLAAVFLLLSRCMVFMLDTSGIIDFWGWKSTRCKLKKDRVFDYGKYGFNIRYPGPGFGAFGHQDILGCLRASQL